MNKNFQKVYSREESDVGSSSDSYILRTLEKENHILSILKHGKSNLYFYFFHYLLYYNVALLMKRINVKKNFKLFLIEHSRFHNI